MNTDKIYAEGVANEYAPKDERKVIALRKLDRKAKAPAHIFGYTWGTIFALVLGVGMCLCMKVIGGGSDWEFIIGVIVGVLGLIGVTVTAPIYNKILESGKKKYASDIMTLAKQISEEAED